METDTRDPGIDISGYPLPGIIRKVRRIADFSQRELAKYAKVSPATIAGYETGAITPSLRTLRRVLHAANYQLVIVDVDGRLAVPLEVWEDAVDGAGRRYPAHLDTILDPVFGEWWADIYGLESPPETFRKNRAFRDWKRAKSQWDVRKKKFGNAPPPRKPLGPPGWEWNPNFDRMKALREWREWKRKARRGDELEPPESARDGPHGDAGQRTAS